MHSPLKIHFSKSKSHSLLLLIILSFISHISADAPDTLWTKQYGYGPGEACGFAIQQTSDHGFIITGNFEPVIGGSYYSHDVYIVRTDSLGDSLWTKTYGGTDAESGFSICKTNDDKFIIAGKTESFGQGSLDAYLIKVDSNGDTVWTKIFGGPEDDDAVSVRLTSDGGFIIAGTTESFGEGKCDIYVIRTSASGDTVWTRTYGGTEDDEGVTAFQTGDGGFLIVGSTMSFGAVQYDVYMIRTDPNGDTLWTKIFGGVDHEEAQGAQMVADGGFIITGALSDFNAQENYVYVIRTDANGDTLWTKAYDKDNEEGGNAIQQTSDGGYIIAGATGPNGNESNVYLIRLDKEATGIEKEIPSQCIKPDNFMVTNSHANNHISIRYTIPYTSPVTIEAYDIKGKLLKKLVDAVLPKGSYAVTWDTEQGDNAGGVYFLRLRVGDAVVTENVIVLR